VSVRHRLAEAERLAGRLAGVEDVVEAGVEALRKHRGRYEASMEALDAALEEGERSSLADDSVFDRVRASRPTPGDAAGQCTRLTGGGNTRLPDRN